MLQAAMTEIDFNPIAVPKRRSPTRVEADAQKVVEAVTHIMLSFRNASITAKLVHEALRSKAFDLHAGFLLQEPPAALPGAVRHVAAPGDA
jgi:hypothetical protein